MKTPATEEMPMPSGSTDNLSRTLMQMPWGLDCTQLVVREIGAGPTSLTYNGAATVWDLHDSFEHKVEVALALDESAAQLQPAHADLAVRERCPCSHAVCSLPPRLRCFPHREDHRCHGCTRIA